MEEELQLYEPLFQGEPWSGRDALHLKPFVTNIDKSVYAPLIFSPELIGALCSRASRAAQDLRAIFLNEFLYPFMYPVPEEDEAPESWAEKQKQRKALREFWMLLRKHGAIELLQNPKARAFYLKWLAQYGDDSIAQMAGTHLVFCGLSQLAIKHLEDQRIGLAPIEKSTRYVDYSQKTGGQYLYFIDPTLAKMGLEKQYRAALDGLFSTYTKLLGKMQEWLSGKFPDEKPAVIRAKSFDVLRGLLPAATLSQVAFFGNGQAFEYLYSRCAKHILGEVRWAGQRAYEELNQVIPAFLRRAKTDIAKEYQEYLGNRKKRTAALTKNLFNDNLPRSAQSVAVTLIEHDSEGENKIVASMIYDTPGMRHSWSEIFEKVRSMPPDKKKQIVSKYFEGRTQRWQKVGRALENSFVRFEIVMNIGAWRDLHRHRMLTQQRQLFSVHHGYDVPSEVIDAGLEKEFRGAISQAEAVFSAIEAQDPEIAQYAVPLAYRMRFQQWQNLRSFFWEAELRTIPEGHPDYRKIEQEKVRLIRKAFPLISQHLLANMNQYDFARRGQDERIAQKEKDLLDK